MKKVAATLCQLTGYTNINDLNRRYENRFDGAALEHFLGAEQCKGQLNGQAKSLKKYYDDVVGNKVSSRFSVEVMEGFLMILKLRIFVRILIQLLLILRRNILNGV